MYAWLATANHQGITNMTTHLSTSKASML